jgi:hypothetical protein
LLIQLLLVSIATGFSWKHLRSVCCECIV